MENLDREIEKYEKFNKQLDTQLEKDKLDFASVLKNVDKDKIFIKPKKDPLWKRIVKLLTKN